jgi:hypothetical protein
MGMVGRAMMTMAGLAVQVGAAELVVEVREGESPAVEFAAEELRRYVGKATGTALPPVQSVGRARGAALVLSIDGHDPVGRSELRQDAARDEIVFQGMAAGVCFGGSNGRSVLFSVYTFLEDVLGCRWLGPGIEVVPETTVARVRELCAAGFEAREAPDFQYRQRELREAPFLNDAGFAQLVRELDWWAKLRMNCLLINFTYAKNPGSWERWRRTILPEIQRRGLLLGAGEHGSYPLFLSPAQYGAEHPEWYCEIDGKRLPTYHDAASGRFLQFCTSNPDAVATYITNFVAFAKANPEIDLYSPTPNDMGTWCKCARCRERSVGDRYLALDNAVATALRELRPDIRLVHMAYGTHRGVPGELHPGPGVDPDLAFWGRNFAFGVSDPRTLPENKSYLQDLTDWAKVAQAGAAQTEGSAGPRLLVHAKFMRMLWVGPRFVPLPLLAEDLRELRARGVAGFDLPLGSTGGWTKLANTYSVAHLCWDSQGAGATLSREWFEAYYGSSATHVQKLLTKMAKVFPTLDYGIGVTRPDLNCSMSWFREIHDPGALLRRGYGEAYMAGATRNLAALDRALAALPQAHNERLDLLRESLLRVRLEQAGVRLYGQLAASASAAKAKSPALAETCRPALAELAQVVAAMRAQTGRVPNGDFVFWGGDTTALFAEGLEDWTVLIETRAGLRTKTEAVGRWQTPDFPDNQTVVTKSFDVTDQVTAAGKLFVEWQYQRGECGITIRETALWEVVGKERRCLARDLHGGFAGWQSKGNEYVLEAPVPKAGCRYELTGQIVPCIGRGQIRTRGSAGEVSIHLRPTPR